MSKVALTSIGDRRENTLRSLDFLEEDVKEAIGNKNVVIKPNLVSTSVQLASTHLDHLRGIVKFLENIGVEEIKVAEASIGDTSKGFDNFNYFKLEKEFPGVNIEFIDLNDKDSSDFWLVDKEFHPLKVRVSDLLLDPNNFVISASIPKTHDTVVATLSIKNVVMGSVINDSESNDKSKMHQGIKQINYNLFQLAQCLMPDLAVIDGYKGMEGNGPVHGDPVDLKVAVSSLDALAADRVGLELMGIDSSKVGYLNYCADAGLGEYDLEEIETIGSDIEDFQKKFELHENVERQFEW